MMLLWEPDLQNIDTMNMKTPLFCAFVDLNSQTKEVMIVLIGAPIENCICRIWSVVVR